MTNSEKLCCLVNVNEQRTAGQTSAVTAKEEDQSYTKGSPATNSDEMEGGHKILGIKSDFTQDTFTFNIGNVSNCMGNSESMTAWFFDPVGVVSPGMVPFKIFFNICTGDLLKELLSPLQETGSQVIAWC